jgi:hypothetical protein
MKLLSLEQAPMRFGGLVFRTSVLPNVVAFVIAAGGAGVVVVTYMKGGLPLWGSILIGLVIVPLMFLFFGMVRKGLASTNWLMVLDPRGILIKYRSYLNSHMPRGDMQVISLDPDDIRQVCKVKRKEKAEGMRNKKETRYLTFLDITLAEPFGEELAEAMAAERTAKYMKKKWHGTTSSKFQDYPVSIQGDCTLRVRFNSIRPGMGQAMQWFQRNGTEVAPVQKESADFTVSAGDKKDMEDKILRLAMDGRTMAAIRTARKVYGMGLAEAKTFVENLLG